MHKNIENELYKIFKTKKIYIFALLAVFFSIGMAFLVKDYETSGYADETIIQQMIGGMYPLQSLGCLSDIVIPAFATLLVAGLISDELSEGTMKLPLLCGQNRKHTIGAKIIVAIIVMFFVLMVTFVSSVGAAIAFWGVESVISKLGTVMIRYLLFLVSVIGWCMISAFVSLYVHNGGALVGLSVFALVIFEIVNKMFPDIARFQITYYFAEFTMNETCNNIMMPLVVCFITIMVFLILTLVRFKNMEIDR